MLTATIGIGNSDNKLTQQEWSNFAADIFVVINAFSKETYFEGSSEGCAPWQNASWVIAIEESDIFKLNRHLKKVRERFRQDAVAVTLGHTIFV